MLSVRISPEVWGTLAMSSSETLWIWRPKKIHSMSGKPPLLGLPWAGKGGREEGA